jgi:hypothetical protein
VVINIKIRTRYLGVETCSILKSLVCCDMYSTVLYSTGTRYSKKQVRATGIAVCFRLKLPVTRYHTEPVTFTVGTCAGKEKKRKAFVI